VGFPFDWGFKLEKITDGSCIHKQDIFLGSNSGFIAFCQHEINKQFRSQVTPNFGLRPNAISLYRFFTPENFRKDAVECLGSPSIKTERTLALHTLVKEESSFICGVRDSLPSLLS